MSRARDRKRRCVLCGRVIRNGNWRYCSGCHSRLSDSAHHLEYAYDGPPQTGGKRGAQQ